MKRFYLIALVLIILFGSYFRLYRLGVPSFWVDELDFVEAAKSMSQVGEPLLASGYAYPRAPLLTYSLMASYKLFGVSEFSSRLPSAIFGILAIPLVFVIGRTFFNTRVGLIAALFLACAPFAVGWSRACRMYALFQLLFLAGMYFFYRGFEHPPLSPLKGGLRGVLQHWRINLPYLLLGGFFLLLSYSTHQNAGLFLLSFMAYLLILAGYHGIKNGFQSAVQTKYFWSLSGICLLILLAMAIPFVREFFVYALSYQPKWAEVASAQNEWRQIKFLFGNQHFPFNMLFVSGAVIILYQWHKAGIYSLINLIVPMLIFSAIFQYRKNDYIFHVYPLFYLIGAVALDFVMVKLVNLKYLKISRTPPFIPPQGGKEGEDNQRGDRRGVSPQEGNKTGVYSEREGKHGVSTPDAPENFPPYQGGLKGGFVRLSKEAILVIVCSLWLPLTFNFRFAQAIPRLPDGNFNGAIYHNEWKEAAAFLKNRISQDDILISTLPLSVQYYLSRADYNLNLSNSDLARENHFYGLEGKLVDFYSGTDVIENLADLRAVLAKHSHGWLIVDNYRFSSPVYVPEDIQDYVKQEMTRSFESQRKTVSIYRWNEQSVLSTN